ncbi:conserved hypothetical protein [Ricinus communis]|uniref:Uncharacterized protein n=1 Tax=Ricinus communis TaxID=3988 RepID=B9RRK3_RICCO|nr:conserved hypothetical protein [Ricinus communis]
MCEQRLYAFRSLSLKKNRMKAVVNSSLGSDSDHYIGAIAKPSRIKASNPYSNSKRPTYSPATSSSFTMSKKGEEKDRCLESEKQAQAIERRVPRAFTRTTRKW